MQSSLYLFRRNTDDAPSCSTLGNLNACPSIPFCCPTSTTCISLTAAETSVICCPSGSDCTYIQPVTCDVRLQNATAYPYNTLHTTQLNATLPTCGTQCCPLGYSCVSGICAKQQTSSVGSSTTTLSESATVTGVIVPTNSAISIIVANATTILSGNSEATSQYPPRAILIGVAAGLAAGIIFTLLGACLVRRHRHRHITKLNRRKSASTSIFGGKTPLTCAISEPIFTPQYGTGSRADFPRLLDSQQSSPAPFIGSESSPHTPAHQMSARRGSGLPPVFQSPLRFGLPISPMPPPRRPIKGEELAMSNIMPSNVDRAKIGNHRPMAGPTKATPANCTRQNSDDSYISTGSNDSGRTHKTNASTGTINVLMPPPVMTERGFDSTRGMSTYTTMTMMMDAGGGRRVGEGTVPTGGRF